MISPPTHWSGGLHFEGSTVLDDRCWIPPPTHWTGIYGVYNLGVYSLGPPILDLATEAAVLKKDYRKPFNINVFYGNIEMSRCLVPLPLIEFIINSLIHQLIN